VNRRSFIAGSSLLPLYACSRRPPGQRLELSIVTASEEMDPYLDGNLVTAELSWLYADGLTGANLSFPHAGALSVRPPVFGTIGSPSRPSFHYELRAGIRWHDGKALTARDVADCFARVRQSSWAHRRPFSLVESIDVRDDHRFTVVLEEPDMRFPQAFFTPYGSPGIPLIRPGRIPVGTGPFAVRSRRPDAASYERWEGSPRGTPAVPGARLTFLGDGRTQELLLSSGDTDVALFLSHEYVIDRRLPYYRRRSGVAYAILNAIGALDTVALREAFSAAIDRREIEASLYRGWSPLYDSVVAPSVPGSDIRLSRPLDPAFARSVFARAGARSFEIATTGGIGVRIALLMQVQLARVGATATIRTYADEAFLAPDGPLRSGRFDVVLFGEYFSADPDLEASWGCGARPPAGGNFSNLCDPRFDRYVKSGDLRAALRELRSQCVVVPLVRSVQCIGLSGRLRGAREPADLLSSVYQCAQWSIA